MEVKEENTVGFGNPRSPSYGDRITVRRGTWRGWRVLRGGHDSITHRPFSSEQEAIEFAQAYCARNGDSFWGVETEEDQ